MSERSLCFSGLSVPFPFGVLRHDCGYSAIQHWCWYMGPEKIVTSYGCIMHGACGKNRYRLVAIPLSYVLLLLGCQGSGGQLSQELLLSQ